ncbi:MAG: hypothetical protein A2817_00295 [Candidatus Yanofskybacteria bacterium RIFCSPHIGHO2_01_FULL_39_8b]|uniref:Uncharacterized protein n=1 Tax=Candidatus Yanofskybacteria bacterium RIFCSPHIGHO2_01_FULL_39_8b TaxID=1802659 RepID=A0A1F8EGG2_9BACT|nr:MAG: hypothetical protein A2817_00295 [Candidatus Yanofskybacteria bacterium RIFCSPHIGHO2_01_FULL_39_8b]
MPVFSFFAPLIFSTSSAQTIQPTPDAATIEKAKNEYLAKICSGHGGVNCSIVNSDATVVCNDGTIDQSLSTIYAVPECQKTLEEMATKESDFMAESGCFPPSEMTCINEQSYQNLYKHLASSGLANSELGKSELSQCRQQITDYIFKDQNYRRCLTNNGQANFNLSGKAGLPILKAIFCPIFYGNNVSYGYDTDLCVCDNGYFMSNKQCVNANKICQSKYGDSSFAQNGNCYKPSLSPTSTTPILTSSPLVPSIPRAKVTLPRQEESFPLIRSTTSSPLAQILPNQIKLENNSTDTSKNFLLIIFHKISSGIKNIIRLF